MLHFHTVSSLVIVLIQHLEFQGFWVMTLTLGAVESIKGRRMKEKRKSLYIAEYEI